MDLEPGERLIFEGHPSVLQRVLAIGNVNFDTAAGDDYDFEFSGVASPHDVVDAVHRAQRDADEVTLPAAR